MASSKVSAVASAKFSTTSTAGYRMNQLLELTFSTPEGTGFINFNILRILLQEMVNKLDLGNSVADDLDENQKLQIKTLQTYIANSQELEKGGGGQKSGRRPKSPTGVKVITQDKENSSSHNNTDSQNQSKSQENIQAAVRENETENTKENVQVKAKQVEESKTRHDSNQLPQKSSSIQILKPKTGSSTEKLPSKDQIVSDSLQYSQEKLGQVSSQNNENENAKEDSHQTGQKTTELPLHSDSGQTKVSVRRSQTIIIKTPVDKTAASSKNPVVNSTSSSLGHVTSKTVETPNENAAKPSIPHQQTNKSSAESTTNLPKQTIPLMFDGSMAQIRGQNKMSNQHPVQKHTSTSTLIETGPTKSELSLVKANMKNLILLPKDLEDLRREVKKGGKIPSVFDELDILERLYALWEAVNVLKHNDETLAVRMIKQDDSIAKIPKGENIEKIQKLPPEIFDAIISATPHSKSNSFTTNLKPPSSTPRSNSISIPRVGSKGQIDLDSDEVECDDDNENQLELQNCLKYPKISDLLPRLCKVENTMVKKHDFIRLLLEKADKFDLDKKVDIEEFGDFSNDLTTRLSNLIIEFHTENEKFRTSINNVEDHLQSRAGKSDLSLLKNIVIAQIKILEQKIKCLAEQIDQPDPAGTRKKLLKDYNCLSCDRMVNISGVTNTSRVPTFGPTPTSCNPTKNISAAAQRAYDLHQIRQQKEQQQLQGSKCDGGRNMNLLSKELQYYGMRGRETGKSTCSNSKSSMGTGGEGSLVNRYVGGSHTAVRASQRVTSTHKKRGTLRSKGSLDDAFNEKT